MELTGLAWRNIWRNKRRTLITAASIALAIFLSLIMRSIQVGWFDNLVEIVIQSYSGHIQIHKKGYWDDRDINNSMAYGDSLSDLQKQIPGVDKTVPRLEYVALASYGSQTKVVMLAGTDPAREDALTHLSQKVVSGKFLEPQGPGILVAQGLATFLGLQAGDTLVLLGQGYHGVSAAGKFPVVGILHFPSPQLDNQMVYMNLPAAQDFLGTGNRITSLSLTLKDPGGIDQTVAALQSRMGPGYEVMRWDQMMQEIMQQLKVKTAGGKIISDILYLIVGFGILGTVIMMMTERTREFAMMVSVGMQKTRLSSVLVTELFWIGLTGIAAGIAFAMPLMVWYHFHPIRLWGSMAEMMVSYGLEPVMPLAFKGSFIVSNIATVLVIVLVICFFPVRKILRLRVAEVLHK
jgi:putative ABC transport system permease protein